MDEREPFRQRGAALEPDLKIGALVERPEGMGDPIILFHQADCEVSALGDNPEELRKSGSS
jgi:hypothetical protein